MNRRGTAHGAIVALCLLSACAAAPAPPAEPAPALDAVTAYVIQLSGIDRPGAVDRLARANADLVIVDPLDTVRGREEFPMRAVIAQVRATHGPAGRRKLCLAYLNVGQAESYRAFWDDSLRELVTGEDPEGWTENYPVRYWDPRWRDLLFDAVVGRLLAAGYDGLFLDWVAGFEDEGVRAAAREDGVDPAREMARLVRDLSEHVKAARPGFLVVANGGDFLLAAVPSAGPGLDAVLAESVSFEGRATSDWEAPENGDVAQPADVVAARVAGLDRCRESGLVVFTLDYARDPENVAAAEARASERGYVPFVSRTPLDRLPDRAVRR